MAPAAAATARGTPSRGLRRAATTSAPTIAPTASCFPATRAIAVTFAAGASSPIVHA